VFLRRELVFRVFVGVSLLRHVVMLLAFVFWCGFAVSFSGGVISIFGGVVSIFGSFSVISVKALRLL
jgi:hypothetical protein